MLLDDIRENTEGNLDNLRLYSAVADKEQRTIELCFVSIDKLTDKQKEQICGVCERLMGEKFKLKINFKSDYMDPDVLKTTFLNYVADTFSFISSKIDAEGIKVKEDDGVFSVIVTVTPELQQLLEQNEFLQKAEEFFASITSYKIKVRFDVIGHDVDVDELLKNTERMRETQVAKTLFRPQRKIDVEDVSPYIGREIKERPQFIVDIIRPEKSVVICGKIASLREVITPKNFRLFKFDLTDFTGSIGIVMFANNDDDSTYLRLKDLKVDDELLIGGQAVLNTYTQELEIKAYRICRCKICDDNYNEIPPRPVPENYSVIEPKPYFDKAQQILFKDEVPPEILRGTSFVAFDLETTGKQYLTDKIIEIGAIKIVDGKLAETFSTLVNPECRIPAEATKINGIIDRDVENAPTFAEIVADFYKFCYGSVLMGHNAADFDLQFLKMSTKDSGFIFNQPLVDTLAYTRKYRQILEKSGEEKLPGNDRLTTWAKYFDIYCENAHRALDDAIMSAKVFLKLAKLGIEW